jgi:AcrR family transcriptional regulator
MPRAGLDSDRVVRAAALIADTDGLPALTLSRLAQQLGVRSPSLYGHVASLEDLRRRLGWRGTAELADRLAEAAAGRAGHDALAAIAAGYRTYAKAHPGTYMALQRADAADRDGARRVVAVVLAVLRGYGLEGDEAIHAARSVRAALHGFVTLEMQDGFGIPLDLDESFDRLITVLDRGLRQTAD